MFRSSSMCSMFRRLSANKANVLKIAHSSWTVTPFMQHEIMNNFPTPEKYWSDYTGFISGNYQLVTRVAGVVDNTLFFNYSKRRVIEHIQFNVTSLVEGSFVGASASNLLHGQKGIGKSCGLLLGTVASGLLHPNLIAIYMAFSGTGAALRTPSDLISSSLDLKESIPLMECVAELQKRGLYALVIADELDHVYMSNDDSLQKRQDIIAELSELGSQKSGRVYTVACGSASVTPILISKHAVHYPDVVREYPLVPHVTTLNSSRFSAIRVASSGQNDLAIIGQAYGIELKLMSLIFYYSGNNLHRINQMVRTFRQKDITAFKSLCSFESSWAGDSTKSRERLAPLLQALRFAIIAQNATLIESVLRNPASIRDIDWSRQIKPISSRHVENILCVLQSKGHHFSTIHLNLLVDRGFLLASSNFSELQLPTAAQMLQMYPHYNEHQKSTRFWGIPKYIFDTDNAASQKAAADLAISVDIEAIFKSC